MTRTGAGDGVTITSLRLFDFKKLADETLRVGPFTVIRPDLRLQR